jgi:hypothetical protein
MLRLAARSLLAAGLTLPVLAQPAPAADLSAADARADFDALRKAIEEAHGAPYRFSTRAELDRRFDAIRARIDGPLSQRALIGLLSEALAALGDGHSRIQYDDATTAALADARLLPLKILVEGERLIVISNDTPADATIRPGQEILSINGRPAKDILSAPSRGCRATASSRPVVAAACSARFPPRTGGPGRRRDVRHQRA